MTRSGCVAVTAAAVLCAVASPAWAFDGNSLSAPAQIVVGSPGSLTPGEVALQAELQANQYSVTIVDDNAPASADASIAAVLLSPSVDQATLGSKYRESSAPVIALGYGSWAGLNLTVGGATGTGASTADLLVVDSTHPIAAGLPSTFAPATITSTLQSVADSNLPTGAEPVAVRSNYQVAQVVYTISKGGARGDGSPAPANRVALGLTESTLANMSDDGRQLLDNAVYWSGSASAATGGVVPAQVDAAGTGLNKTGEWQLNVLRDHYGTQPALGYKFTPSALHPGTTASPGDDAVLDQNTTVTAAAPLTGDGHALRFPGWFDGTPTNGTVSDTASSTHAPSRAYLDPDAKRFLISVWVNPRDTTGNTSLANDTGNIVQKGTHESAGGQWKVSIDNDTMQAVCTFRDPDFPDQDVPSTGREIRSHVSLTPNASSRITCELNQGVVTVRVYNSTNTQIDTYTKYPQTPGYAISTTDDLWVGKKPAGANNSTKSGDAFSGVIDLVQVYKAP